MKKFFILTCIVAILLLAACSSTPAGGAESSAGSAEDAAVNKEAAAALSDWILGTDLGIVSGRIDTAQKSVYLTLSADRLQSLTEQDKRDIRAAIIDILSLYLSPSSAAQEFTIQYKETADTDRPDATSAQALPGDRSVAAVNLVFIHHSCGENWLNDGLSRALNENGYHVADICYGWREYGDNTDTIDWPTWFTDTVMNLVYQEMDAMTASNGIQPAGGENVIIMFKSCFPNSDVGSSITDEKAIYNGLLPYFEQHPEKMFVLVTPPPMIHISNPAMTRELCNWLCDRETGWLCGLSTGNVFVFDFYNVLTHPNAHHYYEDGREIHKSVDGANTLYYDSGGDDHPNKDGNVKATREFLGLLNHWCQEFMAERD